MPKGRPGLVKGVCGNPHGRSKGSKGRWPAKVKEAFFMAFFSPELGGFQGLVDWASKNQTSRNEFYSHLIRLMPKEEELSGNLNVKFSWIGEKSEDINGPV